MSSKKINTSKDSRNVLQDNQVNAGKFRVGDNIYNFSFLNLTIGVGLGAMALVYFVVIRHPNIKMVNPEPVRRDSVVLDNATKKDPVTVVKPPKLNPSPSAAATPSQTTKEETTTQLTRYVNAGQPAKTAFFNATALELSGVRTLIQGQFEGVSDRYFRPAFAAQFGHSLSTMDFAAVQDLGLPLHCICQIVEKIEYEKNEDSDTWTARGDIRVLVYDVKTGKLSEVHEIMAGEGYSRAGALQVLENQLLSSKKLANLDVSNCK